MYLGAWSFDEKEHSLISPKFVGIRLDRKKDASLLNWNLKRPYPPEKIHISISKNSALCVHERDVVQCGQKIAEPKGPESVSVHASLSGVIEKIARLSDAPGREAWMIEIRRQGSPNAYQFPLCGNWGSPDHHKEKENKGRGDPKTQTIPETRKGWTEIPKEELLKIFQNSGLVTTDPQREPVHVKLQRHAEAQTVIINACEPEPYVTCEQVLTLSHAVEILKGAELLKKALKAPKIIFALEDCNLEMIELIKSKIYFLKWDFAEVRTVPAFYPQGIESALLQSWFPGKEDKAVVFPASTAFAVYEAVALQKPFYERVVTVGGECVVEPRSLWLPFGISFQDAIHACKGMMREPGKVLRGGPMAGTAQTTTEVPVTAGTSAILALPQGVVKEENEEPCIRCNLCVDHCPVSLSPAMITLAAENKEFAVAEEWNVADCIECGNCAYVCPSKRPMLKLIRSARERTKPVVTYA